MARSGLVSRAGFHAGGGGPPVFCWGVGMASDTATVEAGGEAAAPGVRAAKPAILRAKAVPIKRLKPYEANPRRHPRRQIDALKGVLVSLGWQTVIVIDGDNTVVCGHGRLDAAKELARAGTAVRDWPWHDKVPAVMAADLSARELEELRLADNKLASLGAVDHDKMRAAVADLTGKGSDLARFGFSAADLSAIMKRGPAAGASPAASDAAPVVHEMKFQVHTDQKAGIEAALVLAKAEPFEADAPNKSANGNALARVCQFYAAHHG